MAQLVFPPLALTLTLAVDLGADGQTIVREVAVPIRAEVTSVAGAGLSIAMDFDVEAALRDLFDDTFFEVQASVD